MVGCLEDDWAKINDNFSGNRENIEGIADNPLTILFHFLELSAYPPPEVLLVLNDMFETYKMSAGKRSMEDVFFGPPKKGVGNYAAQISKDMTFIYYIFRRHKGSEKYKRYSEVDLVTELKKQGGIYWDLLLERRDKINASPEDKGKLLTQYNERLTSMPTGCEYFASIGDEESFLRQYRRKGMPYRLKKNTQTD